MKKILICLAVFMLLAIPNCVKPLPYPHYGTGIALADYDSYGPQISIEDVFYKPGRNNYTEDKTVVTLYGTGWETCDRITVYVNGMRNSVFDPGSTSWTTRVEFTAIRSECSIQVEGSFSGRSNILYFDGAVVGPLVATIQPMVDVGVVGTDVGIKGKDWYPPRGLIKIFFGTMKVAEVFPAQTWETTFKVPERPAGIWPVKIQDESYSKTFDFEIMPSLTIEPRQVSAGQLVTISGTGFAANRHVYIMPVDKLVFTNSNGSFRLEGIVAPTMSFILDAIDENDNEATLPVSLKVSASNDSGAVATQQPVVTYSPAEPPSLTPGWFVGLVSLLGLALIIVIVLLIRRRRVG